MDGDLNRPQRQDGAQTEATGPAPRPRSRVKRVVFSLLGLVILAALIVGGVLYYLHARHFEDTDDAFIDGNVTQVSAQIGAKVLSLAFKDNQRVAKDDLLIQLDPRDFQARLQQATAQRAQAQAQLDQAKAGLLLQQANVDQAEAQVRVAQADLGQATNDYNRYRALDPKAITRQQVDTASSTTKSAQAKVDANQQAVEAAKAQIETQKATIDAAAANVQAAQANVDNAQLQLGYATLRAPADGTATKRTVDVGNYVNPGQSLFALVQPQLWVTANFKETQLDHIRPGQPVRIVVDACPGRDFPGHVDSFQLGTGSVFSSLPAENATGNYVKVVQRVPVKITFDRQPAPDECPLAPGLSVEPRVTVRP